MWICGICGLNYDGLGEGGGRGPCLALAVDELEKDHFSGDWISESFVPCVGDVAREFGGTYREWIVIEQGKIIPSAPGGAAVRSGRVDYGVGVVVGLRFVEKNGFGASRVYDGPGKYQRIVGGQKWRARLADREHEFHRCAPSEK